MNRLRKDLCFGAGAVFRETGAQRQRCHLANTITVITKV